jgi:hypothetical protein
MPFDCSLAGMLKPLLKFNFEPGYCVLLCLWPALLSRPSLLLKPILETSVPPVAHGPIFKAFFLSHILSYEFCHGVMESRAGGAWEMQCRD